MKKLNLWFISWNRAVVTKNFPVRCPIDSECSHTTIPVEFGITVIMDFTTIFTGGDI